MMARLSVPVFEAPQLSLERNPSRKVAEASGFGFESPRVDARKSRASGNAGSPQPGLAVAYGREPTAVCIQC